MTTLSEFKKICPSLFNGGLYFRFNEEPLLNPSLGPNHTFNFKWLWDQNFLKQFDLSQIKVIRVDCQYNEGYTWILTLEKINNN